MAAAPEPPSPPGDLARLRALAASQLGLHVGAITPVASGLGRRRFYRLQTDGKPASLIARVEAPEAPDQRPAGTAAEPALEPLRSFLEERGLPVPARYAFEAGVELLEDLGETSLCEAARTAAPEQRLALYREALALLPPLQRARQEAIPIPAFERHLDAPLFAYKAELFVAHSLPLGLRRAPRPAEAEVVGEAFALVGEIAGRAPQRLAHRDFQSQNLMLRPAGAPGARLAMIDIQGALLAPPEYDAVCLLRDSYVELPEAEVAQLLEALRPQLPDAPAADAFAQRFDLLTLTRKGKDHARFLQAAGRGDRRFLDYLPATARSLARAGARVAGLDPRLARLAELLQPLPEAPCGP